MGQAAIRAPLADITRKVVHVEDLHARRARSGTMSWRTR
jgi:hypothetical protein